MFRYTLKTNHGDSFIAVIGVVPDSGANVGIRISLSRDGLELRDGLPFIQLTIVDEELFEHYVQVIFGTDRKSVPKGVIEVLL